MPKRKEPELNFETMANSCLYTAKTFWKMYCKEMIETIENIWIGDNGELCILDNNNISKATDYYMQYYNAITQFKYWREMAESENNNVKN